MMSVPHLVARSLVLNEWAESIPKKAHSVGSILRVCISLIPRQGRDRFLTRYDVSSSLGG